VKREDSCGKPPEQPRLGWNRFAADRHQVCRLLIGMTAKLGAPVKIQLPYHLERKQVALNDANLCIQIALVVVVDDRHGILERDDVRIALFTRLSGRFVDWRLTKAGDRNGGKNAHEHAMTSHLRLMRDAQYSRRLDSWRERVVEGQPRGFSSSIASFARNSRTSGLFPEPKDPMSSTFLCGSPQHPAGRPPLLSPLCLSRSTHSCCRETGYRFRRSTMTRGSLSPSSVELMFPAGRVERDRLSLIVQHVRDEICGDCCLLGVQCQTCGSLRFA